MYLYSRTVKPIYKTGEWLRDNPSSFGLLSKQIFPKTLVRSYGWPGVLPCTASRTKLKIIA